MEVFRNMTRMNNQLKTVVLLGTLSALLVAIGGTMGSGGMYFFLFLAVAMNVGAYFFSDRIVLRMHGARELPLEEAAWLHDMVSELAMRANLPKPRIFWIDAPYANAFATGRNPANGVVAVTRGIVESLSRRELRGVLAHELAHIQNRDILVATIAATIAAAIGHIANMLQWTFLLGGGGDDEDNGGSAAAGLLMAFVAPILALLIQMGISRSREYLADASGARISGDPEALASALARLEHAAQVVPAAAEPATASLFIVNPFGGGAAMSRLFSTHPSTAERVERLRSLRPGVDY